MLGDINNIQQNWSSTLNTLDGNAVFVEGTIICTLQGADRPDFP